MRGLAGNLGGAMQMQVAVVVVVVQLLAKDEDEDGHLSAEMPLSRRRRRWAALGNLFWRCWWSRMLSSRKARPGVV